MCLIRSVCSGRRVCILYIYFYRMEMVLGLDVTICRNVRSIPLHLCKLLYKRLAMKIHSSIGSGPSGLLHFGTKTKNEQSHKKFKSYLLSGTNSVSKKRDFVESLCSLWQCGNVKFLQISFTSCFQKGTCWKINTIFFQDFKK